MTDLTRYTEQQLMNFIIGLYDHEYTEQGAANYIIDQHITQQQWQACLNKICGNEDITLWTPQVCLSYLIKELDLTLLSEQKALAILYDWVKNGIVCYTNLEFIAYTDDGKELVSWSD